MSVAIPSSYSFELLSRLPPNSFLLSWKEVRPDQTPLGNKWRLGQRQKIRFVLRGAPNEFLLNTNAYLCGNSYVKIKQTTYTVDQVLTEADLAQFAKVPPIKLNAPVHFFQSSRESFNSGSLPYLDNQDITRSHEINNLRYSCARRNRDEDGSNLMDISAYNCGQRRLQVIYTEQEEQDFAGPVRLLYANAVDSGTTISFGKDNSFQIPLGTYSNFVNSHSIIPIGLCSSYSVNGWQIELETTEQDADFGKVYHKVNFRKINGTLVPLSVPECEMTDLRIYMPIVKILDPSVMASVLSLYEKREMVNVGGVQFPLSMRVNSIAYRTASFPLYQGQKDYFFRMPGTDRSVRAMGYWIYNKTQNTAGYWTLADYGSGVRVSRLETHIGNDDIHGVIEDPDTTTNNVSNFVNVNLRRSASLFSPLPAYQEGAKFEGQQEDYLNQFNNVLNNYVLATTTDGAFRKSLCYGMVSFENLDRREGDYSGNFQASGKDLTNAGAIEVRMRVERVVPPAPTATPDTYALSNLDKFDNSQGVANNNYEILIVYAYDSILEVSPQGVMDVSNAAL